MGGLGSGGVPRNDAKVFAALLAEEVSAGVANALVVVEGKALAGAAFGIGGAPKVNELELAVVPNPPNEPNFGTAAGNAYKCT